MKKMLAALLVALGAAVAGPLHALENHADFKAMKPNECNECHRDDGVPPNHQAGWNADHRRVAAKPEGATNCTHCHDQAFCADCHFGGGVDANPQVPTAKAGRDYMPRSHRGEFRETHPIQAAEFPASCTRCHPASYCTDCHRQYQPADLAFQSHRKGFSDVAIAGVGPKHSTFGPESCRSCHPNSLLPTHRWTSSHRQEARRNLSACQSCHPDGDVCMTCHSARSGLRVKIHPGNWGSIKGRLQRASGQRSCVKCHDVIP